MQDHEQLIRKFYNAFSNKDYKTMQSCYHPEAVFNDAAFSNLNSQEVKAMWEMLLTSGSDLRIEFRDVKANATTGSCHWEAWYTFSATGRKVHNVIDATFEFKDGKFYRHTDRFNFWRWSRQSLGTAGVLLGWSPMLHNKVRNTAKLRLHKFMEKNSVK
jgi:ketosteroid isomerase-like protein